MRYLPSGTRRTSRCVIVNVSFILITSSQRDHNCDHNFFKQKCTKLDTLRQYPAPSTLIYMEKLDRVLHCYTELDTKRGRHLFRQKDDPSHRPDLGLVLSALSLSNDIIGRTLCQSRNFLRTETVFLEIAPPHLITMIHNQMTLST